MSERSTRWLQMGAEIEGAWTRMPADVAAEVVGARAMRDGSLHNFNANVGEIITRPHADLEALLADLVKLHPDETNETAGFHIHASFTPMDTTLLTTQDFWDYFRMRWDAWGRANDPKMSTMERRWFWNRFHEKTPEAQRYCQAKFQPDKQLADKGSGSGAGTGKGESRYTQINFNSYHRYRTIECRLLPMFESPELIASAVRELSDIYNSYLAGAVGVGCKMEKKVEVSATNEVLEVNKVKSVDLTLQEEMKQFKGVDLPYGPGISYYIQGAQDVMLPFNQDAGVSR